MAVVLLPSLLATEAGGQNRFEVDADTVRDALRTLPIADLIFDERGELRGLVNVYLDGVDVRDRGGIDSPLEADEIRLVGAIAGGAALRRAWQNIG
jgi:hypothetical protein